MLTLFHNLTTHMSSFFLSICVVKLQNDNYKIKSTLIEVSHLMYQIFTNTLVHVTSFTQMDKIILASSTVKGRT